jgi:alpha-tubulin suppressor-like RCC1 family protein
VTLGVKYARVCQLGTGDAKDSPVPVKITNCVHRTLVPQPFNQVDVVYEPGGLPHVSSISAGMNHSLVVTTDGTVYCCGWNEHGRCGFPTSVDDDTVNTFVRGLVVVINCFRHAA